MTQVPPHLYIHIPFCKTKCPYCDFYSETEIGNDLVSKYIDAVKIELNNNSVLFDTVYIGGGTPSFLPLPELKRLLNEICKRLNQNAEFTIEINPSDFSRQFAETIRECGVNRISLGVQSMNDDALKKLERRHSVDDNREAIKIACDMDFESVSADAIFGMPLEYGSVIDTLSFFIENNIVHISLYELTIEGTSMWNRIGYDPSMSDEEKVSEFEKAVSFLESNGIMRYEISNFAKPGFECRSHLNVWKSGEYLGIGAGAHGFVNKKRYYFEKDIHKFIYAPEKIYDEISDILLETLMLGMRLTNGINLDELSDERKQAVIHGEKILSAIENDGYIIRTETLIKPTAKGLLFLNNIADYFIQD